MGVFRRPDSPYWWLWLELKPGHPRERTAILVGTTASGRQDSKRKAEAVYRQRMDALAAGIHDLPGPREAITFADYAAIYARDVVAHHKGAIREREILVVLKAAFEGKLLGAIDKARVQQWMAERRKTVSARTVNRELDVLKSMLRDAVPRYLSASPIVGLKRLPHTPPARRILSPDDEAKLLEAATDPQDRALLILGLDTLIRLSDLLGLRRADRRGVWLTVRDPKGGQPYEVPLSPRAQAALDAIPGAEPYYFAKFRTATKPRDWRGSVRQRLEYLCKKAGVTYGRKQGGITFHWATRRTGATRLLIAKGQPIPVVQRLGDWKHPDVLLAIYAEAQREDLLKAVGASGSEAGATVTGRRRKVAKNGGRAKPRTARSRPKLSK